MDLGFNLAQSNRDLKDLTSRQNFGDTSGLLCKNDLIPCPMVKNLDCRIVQWTRWGVLDSFYAATDGTRISSAVDSLVQTLETISTTCSIPIDS